MRYSKTIAFFIYSFLFISCFSFLHGVNVSKAAGTIIYVDDGGGADYTTITAAINAAQSGYTIYVHSGTYDENIIVDKSLTLSCVEGEVATINGVTTQYGAHVVKITTNYVNISGFFIQNAKGNGMKCLDIENANYCTISNCIIQVSDQSNGVALVFSHYNVLQNNTIRNNEATGLSLTNSNYNLIKSNTIYGNSLGVDLTSSTDNTISENNNIHDNTQHGIRLQYGADNNIITQNSITGNSRGISCIANGNLVHHNTFQNGQYNAYDTGSNTWDNGYSSGGNSWSDYVGVDEYHGINQDISGSDGFGDTHYSISGGSNQDHYPLYTGNKKPTATIHTIDPTTASYGATIFFSGGGIDQDGSIVQYSWISNRDGQLYLGSDSSFSTSSLSSGIHEISFTVKDNVGDWSNPATAIVTIIAPQNQKPVAHIVSINPTQTSFGSLVYFYGYGNDEGTIIAYKWTSSIDGVFGTQQSFNRSNLSVGNHLISFQVMDSQGLWSDEDARSLVVVSTSSALNLPPVAIAGGPYSAVVNISLSFDASQSHDQDPQGSIVSYVWNFGDDTTANGVQVEHIYAASGNYTVTLQVTDNNGTKTTATTQASVYKPGEQPNNGGSNGNGHTETPDNGISFDIPWMIVVPVAGVLIFVGIIIGFFSWMKRS